MDKNKKDIYSPYKKSDFYPLWYNDDLETYEPYKIIRQLTNSEKQVYIEDGFVEGEDWYEEMYLIKPSSGKETEVFDDEILRSENIDSYKWESTIKTIISSIADSKEDIESFIKDCKIEKWIKDNF